MVEMNASGLKMVAVARKDGDYEQGGVLYCGKCRTRKQCIVELFEEMRTVTCMCKCETEAYKKAEQEARKREHLLRISQLRTSGLQDKSYRAWTFDADDGKTPFVKAWAKKYCEKWDEVYAENAGLLLYGGVGTGKSFTAACIANELISRGVPVLMTNFIKLTNELSQNYGSDKNAYIRALDSYDLLIIDDLGAERSSDFMAEQVFNIIDSRYRAGKPLIVTTNLRQEEFGNPTDIKTARIYDRVREMTSPLAFKNENRRKHIAEQKYKITAQLMTENSSARG